MRPVVRCHRATRQSEPLRKIVYRLLACAVIMSLQPIFSHQVAAEVLGNIGRETVRLPVLAADIKGFTIDFTWNGQTAPGYLGVDIQVNSTSTFAADERLTLRVETVDLGHSPPQNGMAIDIPIEIDQGDKVKSVRRMLPKWSTGNGYRIRVFDEQGERKAYAVDIGGLLRSSRRAGQTGLKSESSNDWLIVCDPDRIDSIQPFVAGGFPLLSQPPESPIPHVSPSPVEPQVVSMQQLPIDWRALQAIDAIVIEQSELPRLGNEHPTRFAAMRDWILCGGTLIVFQVKSIDSVCQTLNVSPTSSTADQWQLRDQSLTVQANYQRQVDELVNAIKVAKLRRTNSPNRNANYDASMATVSVPPALTNLSEEELQQRLADARSEKPNARMATRMWQQHVAAGRIIAIDDSEPIDRYVLSVIARTFGYRQSPMLRRGVDPLIGDQRVHNWMIPGVAQPPVYTFMALLTLFVLLVGPVAYRQTTKSGRGYLMFAIAPALALVTTAMMLIYGVVADGFGTQTRVRQLTWVDGTSGDAAERTRGTYFSGVRPVNGISFPADSEVMAYPDLNDESWEALNQRDDAIMGTVVIRDDRQQFDSNYLPSRTQKQFVVHQPKQQVGRLTLVPRESPEKTPTVNSEFNFQLRRVVLRDNDGVYWSIGQIEPGASSVSCNRATANSASEMLGKMYNDHRPISETRESNRRRRSQTRDLISRTNQMTGDQSRIVTDGTFEYWLQQSLQITGEIPKGHFVAIANISDDVVWVDGAESVASVRFVFGTLP